MAFNIFISNMQIQQSYLFFRTADRALLPLLTTHLDQLLPLRISRLTGDIVIWAWEISPKNRLLPTMTSDRTATGFVQFCLPFSENQGW